MEVVTTDPVEERFKEILDLSSDIILTHVDGVITYVNDQVTHITGYSREELLHKSLLMLIPPEYENEYKTVIGRRIEGNRECAFYQIEIIPSSHPIHYCNPNKLP